MTVFDPELCCGVCALCHWKQDKKHWNEGMLASLGNSWHFVETHKHPPEDPLYCKEAKQRIRTNKSGAHEPLSLSLSPPTGYHLGTTCSWPIASRCRFAIEFLQTFLSLKLVSQPAQVYSAPEFINIGILAV